jgi:hypothetical protein
MPRCMRQVEMQHKKQAIENAAKGIQHKPTHVEV